MKKVFLPIILSTALTAQTAFAGNLTQPVVEAPVIVEEASEGSSGGVLLPIILLVLIGIAVSGGGSSTPPPPALSDATLKTDVVHVGTTVHGLPLYQYRYVFGTQRYEGVMAQDVQQVRPDAVHRLATGHLAVDYRALGIETRAVD